MTTFTYALRKDGAIIKPLMTLPGQTMACRSLPPINVEALLIILAILMMLYGLLKKLLRQTLTTTISGKLQRVNT